MLSFSTMWFQGMRTVAEQTGWQLTPPDPVMMDSYSVVTLLGESGGVPVRLERSGFNHTFVTSAFFQPVLPVSFAIRHQGLGGTIASAIGFHDIEIGDPDFDRSFRLLSQDPAWLTRLLTPEAKAALVGLSKATESFGDDFYVSEGGVSVIRTYMNFMTATEVLLDTPLAVATVRVLQAALGASR